MPCPDAGGAASLVEPKHESTKITYTICIARHFRSMAKIYAVIISRKNWICDGVYARMARSRFRSVFTFEDSPIHDGPIRTARPGAIRRIARRQPRAVGDGSDTGRHTGGRGW